MSSQVRSRTTVPISTGDRLAAIDVGTNSILLTVAEREENGHLRPLLERSEVTRLGRGVDESGLLAAAGEQATLRVLGAYVEEALGQGIRDPSEICSVATSAVRDARNGRKFIARVHRETGLALTVIDGEREAQLAYLAARCEFPHPTTHVVADIGGGSTELIWGTEETIAYRTSLAIGSVRLFERWIRSDPPTTAERSRLDADLERALESLPTPPIAPFLVGIAGTWTTLAVIELALDHYDAKEVHGRLMSAEAIGEIADRLWKMPLEARLQLAGLQPGRADVIPMGASIAFRLLVKLGMAQVKVSDRGVRWGLLYERAGR